MALAPQLPAENGCQGPEGTPAAAPASAPPAAAYANHFEVGFNAFEFLLDFGQDYGGAPDSPERLARVVTAPAYAKVFSRLLARSVGDWEAAYGALVLPPAEPEGPASM